LLTSVENDSSIIHRLANWRMEAIQWGSDPDNYLLFGIRAMETGHPSLAYEILKEGLTCNPKHPELTYRVALALARCHTTQTAADMINQLLEELDKSDPITCDVYSLAGRLAKDRWEMSSDPTEKMRLAWESTANYKCAYKLSNDYYPGINAATMSIITEDTLFGIELAKKIKKQCLKELSKKGASDYWLTATLGEACLLLNQQEEASDWYQNTTTLIKKDYGNLAAIRRQVKILSNVIAVDNAILKILKIPNVIAFTGHMIDSPDREKQRFTLAMELPAKQAISDALDRIGAEFGYCSAACGADILFIEAMLQRDSEVQVILPFKKEDFIATSVAFSGGNWLERFNKILKQVKHVHYATEEGYQNDDILFEYCASLMSGMSILRADLLETEPILLAVLDPSSDNKVGGTNKTVSNWGKYGYKSEIINLHNIKPSSSYNLSSNIDNNKHQEAKGIKRNSNAKPLHRISRKIKTMLFADVVGFSKLGEEETPNFFVNFLNEVASIINSHTILPAFCNTWGDGLFLVYDDIVVAADVALRLRDTIREKDWENEGLPKDTNIRIGMHAGPVYAADDPIIKKINFYGSHVNRAARIEPITTPGSIFISEQTACLLTLTNNKNFIYDYLGPIDLAKKYGTGVLYRLRRKNEIE